MPAFAAQMLHDNTTELISDLLAAFERFADRSGVPSPTPMIEDRVRDLVDEITVFTMQVVPSDEAPSSVLAA